MSDEDDYLTMEILDTTDPVLTYQQKRTRKLNEQSITLKPKKIRIQEDLDEQLSKEISSENKGFRMLQKMGYKPGSGSEPIPIQLKNDKLGIGSIDPLQTRKYESIAEKKAKAVKVQKKEDQFVSVMKTKFEIQQMMQDVRKVRDICMSLDMDHQVERHCYWPPEPKPVAVDPIDHGPIGSIEYDRILTEEPIRDPFEDDTSNELKLKMVNEYVRETYFYCIWCGCQYDSLEEMNSECPGDTRKDHDE